MTLATAHAGATWYAGLTAKHWRVLWGSYLGWVFDGYEAYALVAVLPAALKSVLTPEQLAAPAFYAGLAIGITLLGWGIGGLLGGIAADYIGRKRMMMLAVFLYALFAGLTAFADSFLTLAVLRFITGLAMGSEWSTGIALVAETWPDRARPKGCGFLQSGFGGGALLAALVWFILSQTNPWGAESWRIMFLLGALPALAVLYLRRALDESERWIKAVKEQKWAATEEDARSGIATRTAKRPFTLAEILREPQSRRRILLLTLLSFAATAGWWAVSSWLFVYTEQLAKELGLPAGIWGPRMGLIYNASAILGYLMCGFVADALGRRKFLFVTFLGSLIISFATYSWHGDMQVFIAIAFLNGLFTQGFAYGWMAIYPAELFTSTVRSTAVGFIFNAARLIAWIFPIIAGSLVTHFGGVANAAMVMAGIYVTGLIVPLFVPETAGKPLPA
jgi:MFS family permease